MFIANGKEFIGRMFILLELIIVTHGSNANQLQSCCPPPVVSKKQPHCRWVKCPTTNLRTASTTQPISIPPTSASPAPLLETSINGAAATEAETATQSDVAFHPKSASAIQCGRSNTGNDSNPQTCLTFNKNPCDCRANGCEFNPTNDGCYSGSKICEACETNLPISECRRSNAFYLHEGVACKSTQDKGNCTIAEVIIAVNFGSTELTDSAGIKYQSFYDVHPEVLPVDSRMGNSTNILTDKSILPHDRKLYENFVFGSPTKPKATACLTYQIQFKENGVYEMSLKFFEYAAHLVGRRGFDIRLNGITISRELDIIGLTGDMRNGLNLIVNFVVDEERSTLLLPGFPPTPMKNGTLVFELCNGACRRRSSWRMWTISAFSIIKFNAALPSIPTPPGNQTTVTVKPPVVIPRDKCDKVNEDSKNHPKRECHCHQKHCEFALDQRVCVHDSRACPPILQERSCHREDAYFVQDGVVCKMTKDDNCELEKPILAINVNGGDHTSKNGIFYRAEKPSDYIYNYYNSRRTETYEETKDACSDVEFNADVTGNDAPLFYTLVHGWSSDWLRKPENCLQYPIRIQNDGLYEVGMKFIETFHAFFNSFFTVKLNNQTVLSRFDMVFHTDHKCIGVDVYFQFHVKGRSSILQILGHNKSSPIYGKTINLSFCYGDLTTDCIKETPGYDDDGDPNYSISAFHVARFKNQTGVLK